MDPLATILTALVLGATAGIGDAAHQVVMDAYAGLKAIIQGRYAGVDISQLEKSPASVSRRSVLKEDLEQAGVVNDVEIIAQAEKLIRAIENHIPLAGAVIGVDIERLRARNLLVDDVISKGIGARAKEISVTGDAVFRNIAAGADVSDKGKS